ncbi:MAG: winged helix-turn-helix transcriptional regulator [Candidatus Aenigmarchaeota archaeon]|nr:winged helix-turn-helix transcriptional regulator [Candidatus Aenigmarchaeota archaeon]
MDPNEQERVEITKSELEELEYINMSHINGFLFTNENRAAIIYLLYHQDKKKMQTEKMAFHLGISHRTALYHLEILEQCGFVEVREFRRHGLVPMRSVWGLNQDNNTIIEEAFKKIMENYGKEKLNILVTKKRRNR